MEQTSTSHSDTRRQSSQSDQKFVTFVLGKEEYGIEIQRVREIIGIMEFTAVPNTPEYIKGVINLRGKIFPVIDLRHKFGFAKIDYTDRTSIIIVEATIDKSEVQMGVVVDKVNEVLTVSEKEWEAPPSFGSNVDTTAILGMAKLEGRVVVLLDINQVLSNKELSHISELYAQAEHP